MALTDEQKVDVRRHLRYGPVGVLPDGGSFISYRFFVWHGQLEFRMNNMAPAEELRITGGTDPLAPTDPSFTDPTSGKVLQGYLPICNWLEGQIGLATDNYDIDKAGDYSARKNETSLRVGLYDWWCQRLAQFMLVPINPSRITAPNGGALVA